MIRMSFFVFLLDDELNFSFELNLNPLDLFVVRQSMIRFVRADDYVCY